MPPGGVSARGARYFPPRDSSLPSFLTKQSWSPPRHLRERSECTDVDSIRPPVSGRNGTKVDFPTRERLWFGVHISQGGAVAVSAVLSATDYDRVLAILEVCEGAESTGELGQTLLQALAEHLGYGRGALLLGSSPATPPSIRDPLGQGVPAGLQPRHLGQARQAGTFAGGEILTAVSDEGIAAIGQPADADRTALPFAFQVVLWLDTRLPTHGYLCLESDPSGSPGTVERALLLRLRPHLAHMLRRLLLAVPTDSASIPLSLRECQAVDLVAAGWRNREIALALRIGEDTVKKHVSRALRKLG